MGDYLTMNEKTKYDTIKAVVNERKTIERAQVELGLSRKQIKRLMGTYHEHGRRGFRHGNAKRPPSYSPSSIQVALMIPPLCISTGSGQQKKQASMYLHECLLLK